VLIVWDTVGGEVCRHYAGAAVFAVSWNPCYSGRLAAATELGVVQFLALENSFSFSAEA